MIWEKDLDNVRGLAVLMVLLAHLSQIDEMVYHSFGWLGTVIFKVSQLGLMGVQIFFVLSGYLITKVTMEKGFDFAWAKRFYVNRILRIFPLYYITLFVVFMCYSYTRIEYPNNYWIYLTAYLSNMNWFSGIYYNSDFISVEHFWSLCVEEHYYLFFPLILMLRDKWLTRALVFHAFASVVLFTLYKLLQYDGAVSWNTLTHSGNISLGSLLYLRKEKFLDFKKNLRIIAFVLTAVLIFLSRGYLWQYIAYFWGISIGLLLTMGTKINGAGITRFLQWNSKYSYGLYIIHGVLWHPFQRIYLGFSEFMNNTFSFILVGMLFLGVTYSLALLSFTYVERPFLRLKYK